MRRNAKRNVCKRRARAIPNEGESVAIRESQSERDSDSFRRFQVGGAVAKESRGRNRLRKDDTDWHEDRSAARCERHCDFHASAFRIFIAATKRNAALRKIFTHRYFFLKSSAADTSKNAGLDARTVAARQDWFVIDRARGLRSVGREFGLRLCPNRWRVANLANARDTSARFERFQLEFVQINDFAALAEAAFHQQTRERLFARFVGRREFNVPKVRARFQEMDRIKKPIWLAIDFSNDPSAGRFDAIAFEGPLKGDFLAWKKFFVHAQDAAVATDQPGLCDQAAYDARTVHPGRFERHSKGNTIALPQAFCARGGHVRGKSTV